MKDNMIPISEKKVFSLLGLATKAGYVSSGEFMTEKAIKEGKACLVIVASDSSDNTKKKFINMCSFREVPLSILGSKDELGHAMGKEFRASLSVNNLGMAQSIMKHLTIYHDESHQNIERI